MTWICANDILSDTLVSGRNSSKFQSSGQADAGATSKLLVKGSIVAEFDMGAAGRIPTRLVHFKSDVGWARQFTIYLNADFSVSVEVQQGVARSYICLTEWQTLPMGRVRLTYSWDGPAKLGLLTIECLETGQVNQTTFEAPIPMPQSDAANIADTSGHTKVDPRLISLAISDKIEPIGPAPSICEGTLVETDVGPRPIERLQLGDMIHTADNGLQPIRWIVKQDVPAVGNFRPIRLHAPYLDLSQDITVTQNQRVMLSGAEAEYLFGVESVLVEARQLLGQACATLQPASFSRTFYQVLLNQHNSILLSGAWSESLYVGHIVDAPQVLATSRLSLLPRSAMPVHSSFTGLMLRNFETRTLLNSMSA